jgi:hypothetical protein
MAHREKIGEKRDRGSPPGSKNRHADQVRNHMTSVAQVPRCEVPPQMFWHRLCWVCILLVSCGCLASSQQKTERRFYFPVDLKSRHGQGPEMSAGFLARVYRGLQLLSSRCQPSGQSRDSSLCDIRGCCDCPKRPRLVPSGRRTSGQAQTEPRGELAWQKGLGGRKQ